MTQVSQATLSNGQCCLSCATAKVKNPVIDTKFSMHLDEVVDSGGVDDVVRLVGLGVLGWCHELHGS